MDLTGQLHDNLDIVFQFLNSHRPAITPEFVRLREMETETATKSSGMDSVQYCKCRNRDIPGSCTCGRPRDPSETENDIISSEPSPKIHRLTPSDDVLDVQTPFDPEFQESKIIQDIQMKPLTYESVSIQPKPDEPLGAGECNFDRPEPVPRGQVAVEFLPWLPIFFIITNLYVKAKGLSGHGAPRRARSPIWTFSVQGYLCLVPISNCLSSR